MASIPTVLFAAFGATLFFTLFGLGLARWIKPTWASAASLAPALGWGVFTAIAFPLQIAFGFTQISVGILAIAGLCVSVAALVFISSDGEPAPRLPHWAYSLAGLIALIPLAALLPRHIDTGVILGWTASDHSKVAMIDEMTRLGLPAGNPFFGAQGDRSVLSYYYLWHFSAAQVSLLWGSSGWEADAAMTGFTAYASLLMMMGLGARLQQVFKSTRPTLQTQKAGSANRVAGGAAIIWVAILSLTGSLRPILSLILGSDRLMHLLADYRDLETWLAQASWVPQHLASACCVVLAALLLIDLSEKPRVGKTLVLGAVAAAAFGSSAWVGGVAFAFLAAGVGLLGLVRSGNREKLWFLVSAIAAAAVALVLALPLLKAEFGSLATRHGGPPVAFHPFEVIGSLKPQSLRRILDLPAYWILLLPLDLPAIYPAGVAAFFVYVRSAARQRPLSTHVLGLGVVTVLSLTVSWLLISTIGNNDLGWRAMLPAALVLTPLAAAGLAYWIDTRAYIAAALAIILIAISLPERTAIGDITGKRTDDASDFADGPALWKAVRKYAGPTDRVANNPLYLNDLTGYPVNISWALMSNRPSCYSGWETARAYVDLPQDQISALDDQFTDLFAGNGSPNDVQQLAQDYGCRVVVLTDSDGAWAKDPFAASGYYRLAEQTNEWRIYVAAPAQPVVGGSSGHKP